ncbi:MAG TPA: tripartite tricarboxylate transporter substrate-binding protein, partial [Burkholderiales bacterium]
SARRSPVAPGVPAMSETYPGFVSEAWVGLLAPAKTPPGIVARLNAEVIKILDLPDVKERFAEQGLETAGGTPAQLDQWIRAGARALGQGDPRAEDHPRVSAVAGRSPFRPMLRVPARAPAPAPSRSWSP